MALKQNEMFLLYTSMARVINVQSKRLTSSIFSDHSKSKSFFFSMMDNLFVFACLTTEYTKLSENRRKIKTERSKTFNKQKTKRRKKLLKSLKCERERVKSINSVLTLSPPISFTIFIFVI